MQSGKKTLGVFLGIAAFVIGFSLSITTEFDLSSVQSERVIASDHGYPPPLPPPTPPPDDPTVA
ncbi:MAG: hypothetical protein OEM41_02015 [Ignavibacteria bacterium]|nr:hypothetical protein [Ignavibacteria bacterium]